MITNYNDALDHIRISDQKYNNTHKSKIFSINLKNKDALESHTTSTNMI